MKWSAVLSVLCVVPLIRGYPTGPPVQVPGVCQSMTPQHGPSPQTSTSPYTINVLYQDCYKEGDQLVVEINGNGAMFKGFFVQARSGWNENSYGMFLLNGPEQQQLSCFDGQNNAIGHSNRDNKAITNFHWVADQSTMGMDITFNMTVVQDVSTYWVGVSSQTIKYDPWCGNSAPEPPNMSTGARLTFNCTLLAAMIGLLVLSYK